MNKSHAIGCFLLDWLLVCVGVLGSLLCLLTAFSLPEIPGLWMFVPGLALLFCLVFRGKAGRWYALGALALLLLAAVLLRGELAEGFRNLWGELGQRYALGYDQVLDYLPKEPTHIQDALPALAALAVLETFLCSLAVRLWRRTLPAILALLPGILPCFILTDTPPALLPLLAAIFSLLTQAFSQSVRRRGTGEQEKAVALAALLSAALLGLLLLVFPEEDYTPPLSWAELTRNMQKWGQSQSNQGNIRAGLSGSPAEIELTELGALPNHPITVMRVRSSIDDSLYLRGCAYSGFDGLSWSRDTEQKWGEFALFPCLDWGGGASLSVETVDPEEALYTTYQLTQLPEGGELVSDAYLRNAEGLRSYNMRYINVRLPVGSDARYRRHVLDSCLALPEQTRSGVLDWWKAQGESASLSTYAMDRRFAEYEDFSASLEEKLANLAAGMISQCAAYSRNPARPPQDVDFCTWFLNDAEEGYCVHYATACTALLRALGIPARYVSGYICSVRANETVNVTNLQAHAWVEIWVDGCWVVVEPTPEEATEFTGRADVGGSNSPNPTDSPERTIEPLPTKQETAAPTDPEPSTEIPTAPTEEPMPSTEAGKKDDRGKGMPIDLTFLWILLAVIGLPALILWRRALALGRWKQRLRRAGRNERSCLLYRRMCRLEKLGGGAVSAEVKALAKKAGFSQHELNDQELLCLRQFYAQQCSCLDRSGFWKRFLCKYILAVI